MKLLFNVINYQAIWLLCVMGGNQLAWIGLLLIGLHLLISQQRRNDLILIASLAIVGTIIDGTLKHLGLFSFSEDNNPIPFWLGVIWMALATLPNHSLAWLQSKPILASALGAVGGPIAYLGGVHLEAAIIHWPMAVSIGVLLAIWATVTPLLMLVSSRLSTMRKNP